MRQATEVVVSIVVKHVDEEGKIIGTRESTVANIPVNQFEERTTQWAYDNVRPTPRTHVDHRKEYIKMFQRWIVDCFLNTR